MTSKNDMKNISRLNDGGYLIRVQSGYKPNGEKNIISKRAKTKTEAIRERDKIIARVKQEKRASTFGVFNYSIKQYITELFLPYKAKSLKTQSYARLESTARTYIIPNHGLIPLCELNAEDINGLLEKLYQDGLSHSSIKKVHDFYSGLFKYAVNIKRDIDIYKNPMPAVVMIPESKFTETIITPLNKEEIKIFTNVALTINANGDYKYIYGPAFLFMLNTGIRVGEMCALLKEDIDINKRQLRINKGLIVKRNNDNNQHTKTSVVVSKPKTRRSVRIIPLNDKAIKYGKILIEEFKDSPNLISNLKGELVRQTTLNKCLNEILEDANLAARGVHALRHTFVSELFDKNVDIQTISELTGDKVATLRKTYIHITAEQKIKAIDMLNITE